MSEQKLLDPQPSELPPFCIFACENGAPFYRIIVDRKTGALRSLEYTTMRAPWRPLSNNATTVHIVGPALAKALVAFERNRANVVLLETGERVLEITIDLDR